MTSVDPLSQVVQMPSGVFFDGKNKLITPRLGEVIGQAGHVRMGVDKRLWRYENGVYRPDGEEFARIQVRELLGDDCKRAHFGEVVTWLEAFPSTVCNDPPKELLNVANGLLDLETLKLHPHDPGVISTIQIPTAWIPGARCPTVDRFLSQVLPDDCVEFSHEADGYVLLADNPFQKAGMLYGPAGTGKSRKLGLTRALAGEHNCSAVSLHDLGEKQFRAAKLHQKLANICGDIDSRTIHSAGLFKQLTGGDPITAEHKFKDPFEFLSFAFPIFSANELPLSADQTMAWYDRWLVVPLERRFRGTDKEDPNILAKLTTEEELQGLLVKAVGGLRRLLDRGRFDLPPSVQVATEKYRDRLDSVRAFLAESCVEHVNAWTSRPALYRKYKAWCRDDDRPWVPTDSFNDYIRKNCNVTEVIHRGDRGWSGLGLLSEGYQ